MSEKVATLTITAEMTDGTTVSATQVGLALVPESVVDHATAVSSALTDAGDQLRVALQKRGVL